MNSLENVSRVQDIGQENNRGVPSLVRSATRKLWMNLDMWENEDYGLFLQLASPCVPNDTVVTLRLGHKKRFPWLIHLTKRNIFQMPSSLSLVFIWAVTAERNTNLDANECWIPNGFNILQTVSPACWEWKEQSGWQSRVCTVAAVLLL